MGTVPPAGAQRSPDEAARSFGELLARHRRALVSVALDRIGRLDVAEDIAQQAITKAWEQRDQLRAPEALAGWLFRIAMNCCVEWQRGEGRRSAPLADGPEANSNSAPVLEEVIRRETIRETRRALSRVPFKNRVALLMHLSGYSYHEISKFVGVPSSTVRGRLARARSALRRDLARRLSLSLSGKETGKDDRV